MASPLDAIDWGGAKLSSKNVTVYFATAGQTFDGYTADVNWNAYQKAQVMAALNAIGSYIDGFTFTEAASSAGATFKLVLDTNQMGSSTAGQMVPPGYSNSGVGVFNASNGSTWGTAAGSPLDVGRPGWYVLIHELLHGFGLAHPHDTGGGSALMQGVTSGDPYDTGDYGLNQGVYTTMSYTFAKVAGPMALDVALLQQKYGANTATNAGDTVYTLPTGTGSHYTAIWDVGGTDEIRATGSAAATIDLRAATAAYQTGGGGFISAVTGSTGGFTIAKGAVIENATGGDGNDTLIGNSARNWLDGGAGADTMQGMTGDDVYAIDNAGDKILETASAGTDRVASSASFRLPANVEHLKLTGAAPAAAGNAMSNNISGNDVKNTINGEGGADKMWGLGGDDTFVVDNLGDNVFEDAGKGTDKVSSKLDYILPENVENLTLQESAALKAIGNALDNTVVGNSNDNLVIGNFGADTLFGCGGDDMFRWNGPSEGRDSIGDWTQADDSLVFLGSRFGFAAGASLSTGVNFVVSSAPAPVVATPTFLWDADDTVLSYDGDGTGGGAAIVIADFQAGALVGVSDFLFV